MVKHNIVYTEQELLCKLDELANHVLYTSITMGEMQAIYTDLSIKYKEHGIEFDKQTLEQMEIKITLIKEHMKMLTRLVNIGVFEV